MWKTRCLFGRGTKFGRVGDDLLAVTALFDSWLSTGMGQITVRLNFVIAVQRWTFPFVPDTNLLPLVGPWGPSSYRLGRNFIYKCAPSYLP